MNSFNVYGQTEKVIGGNTPVWLGTVKPIPRGAAIENVSQGTVHRAGGLCIYNAENRTVTLLPEDISAGQGASMLTSANAYLYNDIHREEAYGDNAGANEATCAVVMHHPEGLLIERVYPEITEEQIAQLQEQIPGVLLVRG